MPSRKPSLDVLRGIAVISVLGTHLPYYSGWAKHGILGVDLFFVLSGFLISGLLFKEFQTTGGINVTRFLVRRGLKIYPAYYFFVLVLLPFSARYVRVSDFVFMQAYWPAHYGHGWSLSVEEHFYVLLVFALVISLRVRSKCLEWIPKAYIALAICCLALRAAVDPGADIVSIIYPTHLRVDTLFAGVALGWFYCFEPAQIAIRRSWVALLAGIALLVPNFIGLPAYYVHTVGTTASAIGFALILVWSLNAAWLGRLKPLAKIGQYSYSIYLWHWPVAQAFIQHPKSSLTFALYVSISLLVGIGTAKLIEVPALRFRDRHFPPNRNQPVLLERKLSPSLSIASVS
jgi:peptidoglycan/LPS O-acetylase OafA/YrhL